MKVCFSWISKGYCLYNTSCCNVIHSWDVTIIDSTRGFEIEMDSIKDKEPQVAPLDGKELIIDDDSAQSDKSVNEIEWESAPSIWRSTKNSKHIVSGWILTATLGTDLLTVCETLNGLDEREWRQAMDEKIDVQKPCLGSCRTTAWQTSHRKYMGVQEENWLHQISGNTNIQSCHSIRIIAHLNGSSKWYCSAPDGCYHSIPEWNTNRGGVHDTTRRVHWEWKRIFCMQAEAEYNWLQKYLRC